MRILPTLCFVATLALVNASAFAADVSRFTSTIDDLPLMAGIVEVGEGVEFSTPNGRIAEVDAEGAVTRSDVLAFYAATLPQLGWTAADESHFVREDETLELTFEQVGDILRVQFTLAPEKK